MTLPALFSVSVRCRFGAAAALWSIDKYAWDVLLTVRRLQCCSVSVVFWRDAHGHACKSSAGCMLCVLFWKVRFSDSCKFAW